MEVCLGDLQSKEVSDFLGAHVEEMKSVSPPESKHAFDIESLRHSSVTFWSVWEENSLLGCGALKKLDSTHVEIKSMRTGEAGRHKGVATFLLKHILQFAKEKGYSKVSLETGAIPFFEPARRLYKKFEFVECAPFADYHADPNSVFMSRSV